MALREEGKKGDDPSKPAVARTGRGLGLHFDSPAYGDAIITVTLFGHIQIVLKNRTDIPIPKELLGMERGGGSGFDAPTQGDVTIYEGYLYGIWGKARWKMKHDAIVPPTLGAIEGLDGIARVGATFRYFRSSFLEIYKLRLERPHPSLTKPRFKPFDLVDAPYIKADGSVCSAHLYSYVAAVLEADESGQFLTGSQVYRQVQ